MAGRATKEKNEKEAKKVTGETALDGRKQSESERKSKCKRSTTGSTTEEAWMAAPWTKR